VTTFRGPPLSSEGDPGPYTLALLIRDAAAHNKEREALVFYEAGKRISWSYQDLKDQAVRIARALMASGLAKGERVALLMGNRPEWVASAFGIALAGGVLVPVNTYLEATERSYVLAHSDASMLLMQDSLAGHDYRSTIIDLADNLPKLGSTASLGVARSVDRIQTWDAFLALGDAVSESDLDARVASIDPVDDAVIIYTSGTTAVPKGVLHAHAPPCLQSRRFVRHLCLDGDVRAWSAFPLFWTAGFAMVMGSTLAVGGCLVLQETFSPGEALKLLEKERVTTPHAWPHQLAELEQHPDWSGTDLSALRHIESFSPFGRHPSVHIGTDAWSPRAAYGLTETFTIVTSIPSDAPAETRDRAQGKILPGNAIRILNPETHAPQPTGVQGEIAVTGTTLMKGYVKVPLDKTFDADGFFRTGDAGFVDEDGYLHWTGRTSDMIKTGGANVSPVEIETELLHHPALKASGAVGVPHDTLGQIVVVVAVAQEGSSVDEEDVRTFLRGRLASYKIPRRVIFVQENELTLTGNQKIRPEDLRALAGAKLTVESLGSSAEPRDEPVGR
jgi:acyl-CoA synthetase (AMP-forming)/AMP-acid ligase II